MSRVRDPRKCTIIVLYNRGTMVFQCTGAFAHVVCIGMGHLLAYSSKSPMLIMRMRSAYARLIALLRCLFLRELVINRFWASNTR